MSISEDFERDARALVAEARIRGCTFAEIAVALSAIGADVRKGARAASGERNSWPVDLGDLGPLADEGPTSPYHAHLDTCDRCREKPFDLCAVGGELLRSEAGAR